MNAARAIVATMLRLIGWTFVLVGNLGGVIAKASHGLACASYDLAASIGHAASRIRGPP